MIIIQGLRKLILVIPMQKLLFLIFSSFIQTLLSALEFHQIMPLGSWALPPVGNLTLP
jgi:hypothetical protein